MKTIRISEDVWDAMAKIGKFGETPDDVLRKVFKIDTPQPAQKNKRPRYAINKMSSGIARGMLYVEFKSGESDSWKLPDKTDKLAIREVRDKAVAFAEENGASLGQVNAVKKALTDGGYHLTK